MAPATSAIHDSRSAAHRSHQLRSHASQFTLHNLPVRLGLAQLAVIGLTAPWYSVFGLQIAWQTAGLLPLAYLALLGAWLYSRRYATHPRKFIVPDVLLATALLLGVTNISSPAQYLGLALRRPLIDDWLVRADAWLGIDVAALAQWTGAHPIVSFILSMCYASLMLQFLMPLVILGLRFRDREGMWEYVFHFHFCLLITVAMLAAFPAECSYTHLGFTPTIDQARVVRQIGALRAGTFHTIDFSDLDGLVSMPSFHAAGAMMVTWAFRRHRVLFPVLAVVNTGLIAATFMSGVHYFVDVIGAAALFLGSVVTFRLLASQRLIERAIAPPSVNPVQWPATARTSTD